MVNYIGISTYGGRRVKFKQIRKNMEAAHYERIEFNQTHQCLSCPDKETDTKEFKIKGNYYEWYNDK